MLVRLANDACSAQLLLLYSAIYLLYQIKQIIACDLCTLTRDKKLNRDYLLYVISHLTISPSLSSSPQVGVSRMAHNRQGFPLRSNERPLPPTTPPVALDGYSPCSTRFVWGTAQKKWQGMPFFSEIVPVKHHRCTNFL